MSETADSERCPGLCVFLTPLLQAFGRRRGTIPLIYAIMLMSGGICALLQAGSTATVPARHKARFPGSGSAGVTMQYGIIPADIFPRAPAASGLCR